VVSKNLNRRRKRRLGKPNKNPDISASLWPASGALQAGTKNDEARMSNAQGMTNYEICPARWTSLSWSFGIRYLDFVIASRIE
jgi:hypothetical protein